MTCRRPTSKNDGKTLGCLLHHLGGLHGKVETAKSRGTGAGFLRLLTTALLMSPKKICGSDGAEINGRTAGWTYMLTAGDSES